MLNIAPRGSPSSRLWIIAEAPLTKDALKGYLFSSPMGWSYDKLVQEAGIHSTYYTACYPTARECEDTINKHQPPIIVALDGAGALLLDQINNKESVNLWAGSLLQSRLLNYPHYIIPTHGPETCIQDWTERQVVKFIDYGKIREEFEFWQHHGFLKSLRSRKLDTDLPFEHLLHKLQRWSEDDSITHLSTDLETVYPREKSQFFGHPGYPVVVGMAINPEYGLSFNLFQETTGNSVKLWKVVAELMAKKKIIGQNFFGFDSWHFFMLGMPCDRFKITDTMYRHAVLWPELSHKLEFMTRQYTREPYYKSEGHHWSPKDLQRLKRYNALDCCVTYEVWEEEEKEFDERPHLR